MIKAAIIGCGFVADQHAAQISRLRDCQMVGLCDRELLMAQQLADRFHVNSIFAEASEMLASTRPDVVHITTPAQSHYPLGRMCLEAGASVYMEKPFSVTTEEAEALIRLAQEKGLKTTVGHNLQFSPESIRMRELVERGFLHGPPIYMESVQCYSHDDPTYGKALLGDASHWIRSLPGSLLQNLISHGIAKIAEFLPTDPARLRILANPFTSPYLKSIGQVDVIDEVRATIDDGAGTTANFTFSSQFSIGANQLRLYGKKNGLIVDSMNRMLVPLHQTSYKSFMRYFLAPRDLGNAYRRNSWQNIRQFLKRDFHEGYGMKKLIELFYRSVANDEEVPIPYREILCTSRIMDSIFAQISRS